MPFLIVEKTPYSPTISSPLNPRSCYEIPPKNVRRCRAIQLNGRKIPSPVSPTQRLLRQKAEVAWRSQKGHYVRPESLPENDSLDITVIYNPEDQDEAQMQDEQNLRVRIDIDRATVVTVIPVQMHGKVLPRPSCGEFDDDQEGLFPAQRRAYGTTARNIVLVTVMLCVIAGAGVFHLRDTLMRSMLSS